MTNAELHRSIGETLLRMLPEGAEFILMYQTADRKPFTISTMPPEQVAEIFEELAELLRRGDHSDPAVHQTSVPS